MSVIPRVVIGAPASGHGKTAISVGLLAALRSRDLKTAGFKIGSDYVDAAYLGLAAHRLGRNLDPQLVGAKTLGPLLVHGAAGADIAVVEGTMGLYDGLAGRSDAESTAQVAGLLRAPVVLVVDVTSMGQSVAAVVHGFRAYDEMLWLGGVILNRVVSDRHEQVLRDALNDLGVPVLGAVRRRALAALAPHGAVLPPRHEGVGPVVQGALDADRAVRRLGEVLARSVDLEKLVALARSAPPLAADAWSPEQAVHGHAPAAVPGGPRPLVAIAGGPCLTFGYAETAELLTAAGADVVTVDPVRDAKLPDGVAALVIGGGLPESYAEELSLNGELRRSVAQLAAAGKPVVAEGTGLVWLCREFAGRPMCGVLDAVARVNDLTVLGYRQATAASGSLLFPAGARVAGYKLHRTLVSPRAGQHPAWAWQAAPPEGFVWRGVHASYLSLHWAGVPAIAARLVAAARGPAATAGLTAPVAPAPQATLVSPVAPAVPVSPTAPAVPASSVAPAVAASPGAADVSASSVAPAVAAPSVAADVSAPATAADGSASSVAADAAADPVTADIPTVPVDEDGPQSRDGAAASADGSPR